MHLKFWVKHWYSEESGDKNTSDQEGDKLYL